MYLIEHVRKKIQKFNDNPGKQTFTIGFSETIVAVSTAVYFIT